MIVKLIRVRVGISVRNRGGAVGSTPALILGGLSPSREGSIPSLIFYDHNSDITAA